MLMEKNNLIQGGSDGGTGNDRAPGEPINVDPSFPALASVRPTQPSPYLRKVDLVGFASLFDKADKAGTGTISIQELGGVVDELVKAKKITRGFADRRISDLGPGTENLTFGDFVQCMSRLDATGITEMKTAFASFVLDDEATASLDDILHATETMSARGLLPVGLNAEVRAACPCGTAPGRVTFQEYVEMSISNNIKPELLSKGMLIVSHGPWREKESKDAPGSMEMEGENGAEQAGTVKKHTPTQQVDDEDMSPLGSVENSTDASSVDGDGDAEGGSPASTEEARGGDDGDVASADPESIKAQQTEPNIFTPKSNAKNGQGITSPSLLGFVATGHGRDTTQQPPPGFTPRGPGGGALSLPSAFGAGHFPMEAPSVQNSSRSPIASPLNSPHGGSRHRRGNGPPPTQTFSGPPPPSAGVLSPVTRATAPSSGHRRSTSLSSGPPEGFSAATALPPTNEVFNMVQNVPEVGVTGGVPQLAYQATTRPPSSFVHSGAQGTTESMPPPPPPAAASRDGDRGGEKLKKEKKKKQVISCASIFEHFRANNDGTPGCKLSYAAYVQMCNEIGSPAGLNGERGPLLGANAPPGYCSVLFSDAVSAMGCWNASEAPHISIDVYANEFLRLSSKGNRGAEVDATQFENICSLMGLQVPDGLPSSVEFTEGLDRLRQISAQKPVGEANVAHEGESDTKGSRGSATSQDVTRDVKVGGRMENAVKLLVPNAVQAVDHPRLLDLCRMADVSISEFFMMYKRIHGEFPSIA